VTPTWKPCFLCSQKCLMPDIGLDGDDEGPAFVVVCGACRRKGHETAEKLRRFFQDEDGSLWELPADDAAREVKP
jgi:hypothetical protein